MKNPNDPNGNGTRDLPACSAVPQTTAPLTRLYGRNRNRINDYGKQDRLQPLSLRMTLLLVSADETRIKLTARGTPCSHSENV